MAFLLYHKKEVMQNMLIKKHTVIIPMHDEVRAGTLKSILDMAEIDVEDFKRML